MISWPQRYAFSRANPCRRSRICQQRNNSVTIPSISVIISFGVRAKKAVPLPPETSKPLK